jgi:anthranilate phosphoribosyltransferase
MAAPLNRLEELLKKKGIGPEGSKSLKQVELFEVEQLFLNETYSLTTRATILTALLMLPPSEAEARWLSQLQKTYTDILPSSLHFMLKHEAASNSFEKYLCRTIEGKDLNYTEAHEAMILLLTNESVPAFQKGAFLEAQRLKRETFDENKAFFDVLWNYTSRIQTDLPILIDICDNYDGFNRYNNFAPFFAAAIASCGYPCIVHGTDEVAPKFGISSKKIMEACKGNSTKSPEKITAQVTTPSIGWGYINQSDFHAPLYKLKTIRKEMVKRPFLATFEKMMQPIRAKNGNHILTGFTHAHYRTEVAEQLKTQGKSAAAIVVKGLEGSSCPPLNRETIQVIVSGDTITDQQINPKEFLSIDSDQLPSKIITAETTAELGLKALQGERNEAFYQIIYYTSMVITGFKLEAKEIITKKIEENLLSGKVLTHFLNGLF